MLDPRARLLLLAMAAPVALCLEHAPSLGLFTLLALLPLLQPALLRRYGLRAVGIGALLLWSTAISQGMFYRLEPRVPWVGLGGVVIYREGVIYGAIQALRMIALTLAGLAVAATTPPDRMAYALVRLRVPYGLAFLAMTALRMVPMVAEEWAAIRAARAERGRPIWARSPLAWARLELRLLQPLIARCLRRARALAEALEARGFDPLQARPSLQAHAWRGRDTAVTSLAGALAAGVVGSRLLYALYTADAWYHPSLRPLYTWVRLYL